MNMKNVFLVLALLGLGFAPACHDPITIDSDTILDQSYTFCGDGVIIDADNIILDCNGETLNGMGGDSGVVIDNFDGITVKNCDITNFEEGVYLVESENSKILDNTIFENDGDDSGIYLILSNYNTISGNVLDDNGNHGIYVQASSHNTIDDNEIYDHADGIYIDFLCTSPCTFSNYNTITKNEIYENERGITMYSSSHNTIDSNDITDNTGSGIYMSEEAGQSSDHNTITKNNILRNGILETGIRNYNGDNNYIAENVISDNGGAGIRFIGAATDNVIHDNTIERNDVGIYLGVNGESPTRNNITYNDILNNTGTEPDAGIYLEGTTETYVYKNVIKYNDITLRGGLVVFDGENDVIEDNIISYNNNHGIFVCENSVGTQILDNTIEFNGYSGIRVDWSEDILVHGNTIRGNLGDDRCGVHIHESTVTIRENIFKGNMPYGIYTSLSDPENDYPTIEDNTFWIELLEPINSGGVDFWDDPPNPQDVLFEFDYSNVIPFDDRPGTLHGECTLYLKEEGAGWEEVETWTYDDLRRGTTQGYEYDDLPYANYEWYVYCEDDGNNEVKSPHFNIFTQPPDDEGDEEFNPEGGSDTQELFPGVTLTVTGPGSIDINWMLYNTSPSGTTPFTGTGLFLEIDVEDPTEQVCFEIEIDPAVVSALGIDPASLTIFHYNGASWEALSTTVTGSYTLTACTNEFSMFGVGGFFASDSKNEEKEFDVTYEAICPGDQLEVTVEHGSDTVSGAEVRLVRTNPWEGTISEQETSAGKVTFDLTDEGTYEVHVTKSGYRKEVVTLEYSMCGESEESEEVTPPAEEETPPAEEVEPAPEPEEEEVTETADAMNEAEQVISDAQAAIDTAKAEGKDTTEAEAKLREAEEKFQMEDFAAAKQLAEEAKALLEAAAPAAPEEEAPPTEEEEPAPVAEPEEEPEPEPEADYSWVLWLVVIVIIVGAGYWYFTQPKKKRK